MQHFPSDENGDVLRRMVEHGDNLSISRDIDFSVVFQDKESSERMAELVRGWGFSATVEFAEVSRSRPWDVTVINHMLPTHEGITLFENRLAEAAAPLGGHNDGWGCMQQD